MQDWYYGKGLIYYRSRFRLTKLAFLKARATERKHLEFKFKIYITG